MLPDTGRKVWANVTEDTFPPSPGMIPEKSTKINNLAGPPGDGGEVLVGGIYGNLREKKMRDFQKSFTGKFYCKK